MSRDCHATVIQGLYECHNLMPGNFEYLQCKNLATLVQMSYSRTRIQ